MLLRIYPIYLASVSNLYFPVLFPLGIGLLIGGFCFMKLIQFLFKNFYINTFYTILGFTVGSVFVLLPNFSSASEILIGIFSCCLRFHHFFLF